MKIYLILVPYIKIGLGLVLIFTILYFVSLVYTYYYRKYHHLPPGPLPWPLFGNVLQVDNKHMYKTFMKWSKQYGKILSVKLGFHTAMVIHEPTRVRELFAEFMFSGRPQCYFVTVLSGGTNGIMVNQGDSWEEQRRFTLRHLRDFGFGKITMENLILEEAQDITKWMKQEQGHPLPDLQRKFSLAVLSSLWTVVSGQRYSHDDEKLISILDSLQEGGTAIVRHPFLVVAPWIRHILPGPSGYNKFQSVVDKMIGFFRETIDEHKESLEEDDEPKDFIDSYLQEIRKTKDTNSSFYGENGEDNLRAVVGDLFQGGSETTGITLTWAVLFLMTHLEVQKKLQKEIDTVIGQTRIPILYDRLKMPYTEAVILETSRMASVIPLGVFHSAMLNTQFHDYFIPKNTWIWANLYAIHMDSHTWGDPETFNPERFLSKDGKNVLRFHESLLPFSIGKRECPGKAFAYDTQFLLLTSIFQRFTATPDPNSEVPDILDSDDGFYRAPKKFSVIMKERATKLNNPIVITVC